MSENATSPNASEEFKRLVAGAVDASTLQQLLRDHAEREATAAMQSPVVEPPPPHAESQQPPPNFATSFYLVIYRRNSRAEIFEDSQEAFNKALDEARKAGWVW